jgi:hypothetical protein
VKPRVAALEPSHACPGGIVTLRGTGLTVDGSPPSVALNDVPVRPVFVSASRLSFRVPIDFPGGPSTVRVEGAAARSIRLAVARIVATGVHQVDSPVFDDEGQLYLTYRSSGWRPPARAHRSLPRS